MRRTRDTRGGIAMGIERSAGSKRAPVVESLWSRLILRAAARVADLSRTGPEREYQAALEYLGWLLVQEEQWL